MEGGDQLIVSPLVLTELDHLMQRDLGFPSAVQAVDAINAQLTSRTYRLAEIRPADLIEAQQVRHHYEDLALDLADAVGVVIAHRYKTDRIFTLDERDFRAIRPLTKRFTAFRILPADT